MRIPFFRWALLACLGTLAAPTAAVTPEGPGLILHAEGLPGGSPSAPDFLKTPPSPLDPELRAILKADPQPSAAPESLSRETGRWVFVSFGMPTAALTESLRYAAAQGIPAVFRGVPKDGEIGRFGLRIRDLIKDLDPHPAVLIDPLLFSAYGVEVVPTLVIAEGAAAVRTVAGLLSFDWLERQPAGQYGIRGNVSSIQEPDLIDEMKRRFAAIDWDQQKRTAVADYWSKPHGFIDYPETSREAIRRFDPSIRVTRDIKTPDGAVLARAGDTFNPQKILPFSKVLVCFDPTRPGQMSRVTALSNALAAQHRQAIFLASKIDPAGGWDHVKGLHQMLHGPVYLLPPALAARFQIQRLPAVVYGEGERMVVNDLLPDRTR